MKNNEATIFLFIASIIVGILISLNITVGTRTERVVLTTKQYADAAFTKNRLRSEISDLEQQYNEYSYKLRKYENGNNYKDVSKDISEELINNKIAMGTIDVQGEGIRIVLDDASTDFESAGDDYQQKLVHNFDLVYVINDLRSAGAEAIAINDIRVTDRTEVYCDAAFLGVNRIKTAAPFYVTAIGDKTILNNYMLDSSNYLSYLKSPLRGIKVDVTEEDKIIIRAYEGKVKDSNLNSQ